MTGKQRTTNSLKKYLLHYLQNEEGLKSQKNIRIEIFLSGYRSNYFTNN